MRTKPTGGEPGPWVEGTPFTLTTLQETDKSIEYQGSWAKQARNGALGDQVRRTARPGDTFRVPVEGDAVSLVMTAGPGQGTIDVCVDPEAATPGACRTVDLSILRKGTRRVVTNLRNLPEGPHTLQVSVRQAPAELDAIVVMADAPAEAVGPTASPAPAASVAPTN
ncbi:MAG: hypothetical protein R3C32_04280 [Chloroflexota bacterium]